jgi:hypothetical protein
LRRAMRAVGSMALCESCISSPIHSTQIFSSHSTYSLIMHEFTNMSISTLSAASKRLLTRISNLKYSSYPGTFSGTSITWLASAYAPSARV